MSNTGIICTIGPASQKTGALKGMIQAGMNVARLNCSHGTHRSLKKYIETIRKLNKEHSYKVKILQDLEGFRIRIGSFKKIPEKVIELKQREIVVLANEMIKSTYKTIPLDYKGSLMAVKSGNPIYIDDGNISLEAVKVTEKSVRCRVIVPGILKEFKGVNIPDAEFPFAGLGKKDRRDIQFGIDNKVDFIAQSFVRTGQDIVDIRNIVSERKFNCKLIAKIENMDGIKNLDEILEVSDGIMVARGDLGVSLPIYKVPILQKMIIKKCQQKKKIAITATQMLESMIVNLRPTRAEVSDVANAILDSSDYVMLSGETAVGKFPVDTVDMMQKIIDFTEQSETLYNDALLRFI